MGLVWGITRHYTLYTYVKENNIIWIIINVQSVQQIQSFDFWIISREQRNTNLIVWFDPTGIRTHDLPHYRGDHANHYITDTVYMTRVCKIWS